MRSKHIYSSFTGYVVCEFITCKGLYDNSVLGPYVSWTTHLSLKCKLQPAYLCRSLGASPPSCFHFILEVEDILVIVVPCRVEEKKKKNRDRATRHLTKRICNIIMIIQYFHCLSSCLKILFVICGKKPLHNPVQIGLCLTWKRCIAVPVDGGEHARTDVQTLWGLHPHKHARARARSLRVRQLTHGTTSAIRKRGQLHFQPQN